MRLPLKDFCEPKTNVQLTFCVENAPLYSLLISYLFLLVKAVYVHYKKFMRPKVHRVDLCPVLNSLCVFFPLTDECCCQSWMLFWTRSDTCKPRCGACAHLAVATSVSYGFFPSLLRSQFCTKWVCCGESWGTTSQLPSACCCTGWRDEEDVGKTFASHILGCLVG